MPYTHGDIKVRSVRHVPLHAEWQVPGRCPPVSGIELALGEPNQAGIAMVAGHLPYGQETLIWPWIIVIDD